MSEVGDYPPIPETPEFDSMEQPDFAEIPDATASVNASQTDAKEEQKTKKSVAKFHPPTSKMVEYAIKNLKEQNGSSLHAIKKFLVTNYKIDAQKVAPFIKKYLRGAVASGYLVQKTGKGARGSFKLASSRRAVTKAKKSTTKRVIPTRNKQRILSPHIVRNSPKSGVNLRSKKI